MPRFFVASGVPGPGRLLLEGDAAAHLARVLRAKVGQEIIVFDGLGGEYPARVIVAARDHVEVDVGRRDDIQRESPVKIALLQGLCRGERMDLVVRKATELGAASIRPVLAERSVVKLSARRLASRMEHWQGIVISACEQCGRNRLPELLAPLTVADALRAHAAAAGVLLDPTAARGPGALSPPGPEGLALLVGPEGGLSDAERSAATDSGFVGVRLGPRVLRTETAAITGLTLLQAGFGDLGGTDPPRGAH